MQSLEEKKSAVDLTGLAVGIIILGLVVTIGASIMTTFRNAQVDSLPTYQVANETLTTVTAAGETLTKPWVAGVITYTNASNGSIINPGNFSLSVDSVMGTSVITSITNSIYNNSNVNVTYNAYNISDPRYNVADSTLVGLTEFGDWFNILVIIGIAAVILGLIFMVFGNRSSDSGYTGAY